MNESMMSRNGNRGGGGTTQQACAACKYQRRKCGPNCILAPYFPHQRQKQFLNAHKLFGVGKISNMIKDVDPRFRDLTMNSIIYQSDMRALDPVGGCYAIIQQLQSNIHHFSAQLHLTLQQLAFLRASSSSSSSSHYHHGIFNNNSTNNIDDINAMILHHGGSSFQAPPAAATDFSNYHYVNEQQELPQDVVVDPNSEDIHSMNYEALQGELHNWVNSIPMSPLTLEDRKEEEEEHVHVDHHHQYQNDEKPILDLINDVNSDATRIIPPDHQE